MILSAQSIRSRCVVYALLPMIQPFRERSKAHGMTYGLGPAGYDVRVAETFMLTPGEFRLASTVEQFCMPRDVLGLVHDKSTWARRGLSLFNTVVEPGWEGWLTLELSLCGGCAPLWFEAGMPIAQIIFQQLDEATDAPYPKAGKYQNQSPGPQVAILE